MQMPISKIFYISLCTDLLSHLLKKGESGNWGGIRETSYAVWALDTFSTNKSDCAVHPFTRAGREWLSTKATNHEHDSVLLSHYESEVWDTALALISFKDSHNHTDLTNNIRQWLFSRKNSDGAFDGDFWETSWATLALLLTGARQQDSSDVQDSLHWLCNAQNSNGVIISPGYSALVGLCLLTSQNLNDRSSPRADSTKKNWWAPIEARIFHALVNDDYVAARMNHQEQPPWADEIWGNCLVIHYLCKRLTIQSHPKPVYPIALDHLLERALSNIRGYIDEVASQAMHNSSPARTEDLALAVVAMDSLLPILADRDDGNIAAWHSEILLGLQKSRIYLKTHHLIEREVDGSLVVRVTPIFQKGVIWFIASMSTTILTYRNWTSLKQMFDYIAALFK